jgi:single-stranded DNA-binding protein
MNGIEAALVGRVASESVELRTSQTTGKKWARVSLAVGHGDDVEWVSVSMFDEVAERICATASKGISLYCEGRLHVWRSKKDGVEKANLQLTAWKAQVVGAAALGRNKPKKPRAPQDGDQPAANGPVGEAARNWQAPLGADRDGIPFAPEWR